MPVKNYLPSDFEPHNLSKEQKEDPYLLIGEFFDFYNLPEIRKDLWEWLQITVCGEFDTLSGTHKSNIIFLYEFIEQVVEAVHIIHQGRKGGVT